MNILFITTKCPLPMNDGHSLRSFNLLKQVATVHEVHLLSFVKYQNEYDVLQELDTLCASVELFNVSENNSTLALVKTLFFSILTRTPFVSRKYDNLLMRHAIRKKLVDTPIDLVHFDMLPLSVYLNEVRGKKTLLNEHNVESLLLKRRVETESRLISKWFFGKQQKLLENFEQIACQDIGHIITCSKEDSAVLASFAPATPIDVIPNGVDTTYFTPNSSINEEIGNMIFVGGLNWFPNLEGLQWFDKSILPAILDKFPQVHLHIIGQQNGNIEWQHKDAITTHGFVEDIRPYMAKASVFIVPLRIGGGTRLKILNAMSMGNVVVSTTVGAEGLGVVSGENVVLADQGQGFAQAVKNLFEHPKDRKRISQNARKFVKNHYQWEHIGKKLLSTYDTLQAIDTKKTYAKNT